MGFFGFGYLKQKLKRCRPTTLDGLVKVTSEIWIDLQVDSIKRVYDDWRFRLKLINQIEHIENVKIIHKRKFLNKINCLNAPKKGELPVY
jgi:hypothetical protein